MEECIFCKIVNKEIPKKFEAVSANFLSFLDTSPQEKGHTLIIPKKHYQTILDMPDELFAEMFSLAKKIAANHIKNNKATGFNIVINNFKSAGQVIPHLHLHIVPRYANID